MYLNLGRAEQAPRSTVEVAAGSLPLRRIVDTTTKPFGAICRIYTQVKGGHSIGSGVLITPRHVLTCAHVIQPPQNPHSILSITVFPAQNGPADGKNGIKADGWAVKHGWSANCCRSYDEDYGIIRLPTAATVFWPMPPFDPLHLMGKAADLAGYPSRADDPKGHFMYRSRGTILGTLQIDSCMGTQFKVIRWPAIGESTRLVEHELETAPTMSGGPLWSFLGQRRILWGLHAGEFDDGPRKRKRAVLLNSSVRAQIARWVSHDLRAR